MAQGTEAGGHGGRRSTRPFVLVVVDLVAPTPLLAAGGIAEVIVSVQLGDSVGGPLSQGLNTHSSPPARPAEAEWCTRRQIR